MGQSAQLHQVKKLCHPAPGVPEQVSKTRQRWDLRDLQRGRIHPPWNPSPTSPGASKCVPASDTRSTREKAPEPSAATPAKPNGPT
ncbi:MAG: hypothetical protein [Microviridae sp.]|nr:MAG: hypothetical protein [Microviridae sp.]